MNVASLLQSVLFLVVVVLLVKPVGTYLARVFEGEKTFLDPLLRPIEKLIHRIGRIDPDREMDWREYAICFVISGLAGAILLYAIQRLQRFLPWYFPEYMTTPVTPDLAMNNAVSFSTTTTWQAYGGESTMSYVTQSLGFVAQNFLAGSSGLAVGIAFIRGLARDETDRLGNFWVDWIRASLWVLLPVSIIGSLVLIWQGVPMNFSHYIQLVTVEGANQTLPQGPVAALEFIKNLGTNGGGFFNVNGAHPYENPTPLSNWLELLAIVVLPASLTYTFGTMIKRPRQGWALLAVMMFLFAGGLALAGRVEQAGNPLISNKASVEIQPGPNMEGKEVRFGAPASVLTAVATSNGATGSYNSMHDSFMPIGVLVPLVNMLLGEVTFGGLGSGIYSIIMVALVGLFVAGLMVGRSPEYLGNLIGPPEIKLITLHTLAGPVAVLLLSSLAVATGPGKAGLTINSGPHGLTEVIYAYASCFGNNGQTMAGLTATGVFYNVTTAAAMMLGRFGTAIPALALAGLFAKQRRRPVTPGTLPTDTFSFGVLLVGTAAIVGGLSYFAALALGPLVEHFMVALLSV
ncbi:MAG TPA: potassium-transporting ATPase subunit KdpA [Blastocatellia bacterium]